MEEKAVIKVEGVSKVYKLYSKPVHRLLEALSLTRKKLHNDHFALSRIDLSVNKGECVGIIGTNGSGKSTLLKIITGVLNPTSGKVEVNGKISALLELGAGFNMEYTGIENIYLNGTMMGFSNEEMSAKLKDIIDFAEIGDFIYQPVKTYSSGMFARLAFAVAINVEPDILIVDEALSVGDIFFQAKCYRKFNEFKEAGKTILFVSHDLSTILKYCDRSLLIHNGTQIAVGKSNEIVDIYKKILAGQYDFAKGETIEIKETSGESANGGKLWKDSLIQNANCQNYGERDAEIVDFAVIDQSGMITSNIDKNSRFKIKYKVHFNKTVQNPIFTFTIKDRKGTVISGTNTMLENKSPELVTAGSDVLVEFAQTMVLQGGQYLLSMGCTGYKADNLVVYNRLYDACFIEVFSGKDSVGFFDFNSEITVKNI